MKKQFATFLMGIFLIKANLFGFTLEVNSSYDYFRGIPDGSWNGNSGGLVAANLEVGLYDCIVGQIGGSYGLYNWDGRENLTFKNPKALLQEAFLTVGVASAFREINVGLVYDRLFTKHFGIYNLNPHIDQLRFQASYQWCTDEIGIWGTVHLETAHKRALSVPVSFRAIDQLNFFWSHYFENFAKATLWLGAPYRDSLRFHHKTAGAFTAGFALRAPLTDRLFLDGHGAYMRARRASGARQSRNYAANICIGITYVFGDECRVDNNFIYMPVANNSNFLVDTNLNQ